MHRVLGSRQQGDVERVWLRGDGNTGDDPPVPSTHMIGLVVEVDDERGRRRLGLRDRVMARVVLDARSLLTHAGRRRGQIR